MTKNNQLVALFILFLFVFFGCNKNDGLTGKYARPTWLAGKLYTQILTKPELSTFAELLHKTGKLLKFANISLGSDVEIDPSSSINNVIIGDRVKIAKRCSIFGGSDNPLEIGAGSIIAMNSIINGFAARVKIAVSAPWITTQ